VLTLLLIFFLFLPFSVFAAPNVSVIDFPETIIAGDIFNVTFSVSNVNPGLIYHYKIVGDGNSEFLTQPNTSCASNYDTCENINIATNSANIATASAKINMISGIYNLKIRIAQSDKHTSTYNSDIVSVTSILPSPTPTITPTNTPIPTNTPSPTNIPTPSPTKTPTPTPYPTLILTLTPTIIPTDILTSTLELSPTIELSLTEIPTPTSESVLGTTTNYNKKNYLPLIFICLGALFLLTPLIIAKIKHEN
jgi:hypothetical protein